MMPCTYKANVDVTLTDAATIAQIARALMLSKTTITTPPRVLPDAVANLAAADGTLTADANTYKADVDVKINDAATIAQIKGVDAVFGTVDYTTKGVADAVANLAAADGTLTADANTCSREQTLMSKSTMQQPLPKSKALIRQVRHCRLHRQRCC